MMLKYSQLSKSSSR